MAKTRIKPVRGIRALTTLNPYELARLAGCSEPDEGRSRHRKRWTPGALFLSRVRDAVVEGIRGGYITEDDRNDRGQLHEIADDAPSVYTFERWRQFTDLGAWQEEPEFSEEWPKDLTEAAAIALYQIADRLCHALVDAWEEARA
jgi:hypothetical protein